MHIVSNKVQIYITAACCPTTTRRRMHRAPVPQAATQQTPCAYRLHCTALRNIMTAGAQVRPFCLP